MSKIITVTWKTGFVNTFEFDYATKKRIAELKAHYASMSWVEKVEISDKES